MMFLTPSCETLNEPAHKKGPYGLSICCSSNAHAQIPIGLQTPAFWLKFPQGLDFLSAYNKGSGETALMRRLAWTFAGRLCDKYPFLSSFFPNMVITVPNKTQFPSRYMSTIWPRNGKQWKHYQTIASWCQLVEV